MGKFIADTDLTGIPAEDFLPGDNDKTCGIVHIGVDPFLQNGEAEMFSRVTARNGSLCRVFLISDFLGSGSGIVPLHLLPVPVLFQELPALHQRLGMGVDRADMGKGCAGKSHEHMLTGNDLLAHDHMVVLCEQVVNILDNTGCGIFNGEYGKVSFFHPDGLHGILPGIHRKAFDLRSEKSVHGGKTVGTLHALEHHRGILLFQAIYFDKV